MESTRARVEDGERSVSLPNRRGTVGKWWDISGPVMVNEGGSRVADSQNLLMQAAGMPRLRTSRSLGQPAYSGVGRCLGQPPIAKTVREKPLACTLVIGMEPTDFTGPLSQFQATKPTHDDLLQLVRNLNDALGTRSIDDRQLEESFELCWPKLREILDELPADEPKKAPERHPEDMLKELLELSRRTSLTVLESHREVTERLNNIEGRQAYIDTMVQRSSPSGAWTNAAAEVLGGAGASNKSTRTLRDLAFYGGGGLVTSGAAKSEASAKPSKNALRDRLEPITGEDNSEKSR